MSIGQAVFWYAATFCILLVPLIWLLIKRKREKAAAAEKTDGAEHPRVLKPMDWSAALAFRPQNPLSGEMWLKSLIAAFVALCAGVIIVVFIFPLGAGWAAAAAFVAVSAIVGLMFALLE